jgi:alpha-beta hydrolase superfamily lysophospholipase
VKAVLILVHGLGEHCGRYGNVVRHFVPLGYAVYGMDHIGHGRSGGAREAVQRFEDYTDTLAIFYDLVQARQPEKPLFLLGHSMGGLIAFHSLLDHQARFQGAVLSAPSAKVSDRISRATIFMGRVLSVLAPGAGVLALDPGGISRDPEVVSAYVNDPLVFHGKTPARLAAELLKAMLRVPAEAPRISLPIMIVQGSEDRLVDPAGAQMLHDRVGSRDKTLRVYEGLYHEVFNEPERGRVLKDVAPWIEAHLRPREGAHC